MHDAGGDVSKSMNMNPFKNPEDIANRNAVNRSYQYDSHNNSIQNTAGGHHPLLHNNLVGN